jgi:ABC-type antimicrobial peptide transport system permease subunit
LFLEICEVKRVAKKKNGQNLLRGNRLWPLYYAVTSLKNNRTRNIGIALVLAISIALPTTVFSWTNTGTNIAIEDYFAHNAYQFSIQTAPGDHEYYKLFEAQKLVLQSTFTEYAHITPTTVGILRVDGITPEWEAYHLTGLNYAAGIKDGRVIVVTPDILNVWSTELIWEGNLSLNPGEILVSQRFADTAKIVNNYTIEVGSEIGIDVLRTYYAPPPSRPFDPLLLHRQILRNLTVVGIYNVTRSSILGNSFSEINRRNWDPMGNTEAVLSISDSVLISAEELGADSVQMITNLGFFSPVEFIRGSVDGLIAAGSSNAANNILGLKRMVEESDDTLSVTGLDNIQTLQTYINTYVASLVLILLALPVMMMSLMLTIFTSETSISQKKGEISAIRSKGASFGQIFSGFIWESLILAFFGLLLGLGITVVAAPLMGSSTGLLTFDISKYIVFMNELAIPTQAVILATIIAMFLPAAYLFHVSRRIDVTEIGQPTTRPTSEIPEEVSFSYYAGGLGVVLVILLVMPILLNPNRQYAIFEILISTMLLFAAAYLGSRAMRLVTADASERVSRIMGEKRLYLTQSLRRRKGQFIPLLVILTLTLTTTTMMLIQTASFEDTMTNEANYALGSTVRIETTEHPFYWLESLPGYSGASGSTPVIEALSHVGDEGFYLEGISAADYRDIGTFRSTSFVGSSSDVILTTLENTDHGIILSEYHASLWNVTVGRSIAIDVTTRTGHHVVTFHVVGMMQSAPGFGMASTRDLEGIPFGTFFGFQPGLGGFALVNLDDLSYETGSLVARTFLVGAPTPDDVSELTTYLQGLAYTDVFTTGTIEFGPDTVAGLFVAGLEGLTMISFIMCAAMGVSSIALFLGSAVLEREPEYALFRAIGGTKKQIISLVFGEFAGSVLASVLISLGLGILFGYTQTVLTFGISSVWPILPKVLTYPLLVMFLTVIVECIIMIIACYYPARRAGNTNPAEVLRNM